MGLYNFDEEAFDVLYKLTLEDNLRRCVRKGEGKDGERDSLHISTQKKGTQTHLIILE